jgi:transposase
MTRRCKDPHRELKAAERSWLERLSRSQADPAAQVARAKILLAVADGKSYLEAAQLAGRRSDEAVSHLVSRFNQAGLVAVAPHHGGGHELKYGPVERERILTEFRRVPDRARDGSATWSLSLLRHALRQAPDGLPSVSTDTIWRVLHDAGVSWQRDRSWCETGTALRKRKTGIVKVVDPDTEAKKSGSWNYLVERSKVDRKSR